MLRYWRRFLVIRSVSTKCINCQTWSLFSPQFPQKYSEPKFVCQHLFPLRLASSISEKCLDKFDSNSQSSAALKTHSCNCLRPSDVGKRVILRGFIAYIRQNKFILLRDTYGLTQIFAEQASEWKDKNLTYESYVEVEGVVRERPDGQENPSLDTGAIEVEAQRLTVLSRASETLPFHIRPHNMPKESLGLRYRYLHLRFPRLQRNLRLRSRVMKRMSDFLEDEENFVNINTPTLGPYTAGGAQLFIVPYESKSDNAEKLNEGREYYCLSQSPQTYKQLLMLAGLERYYQFAVCYRDETARPDRQPEFMQLDLEMSDVGAPEIRSLVERLLVRCWPDDKYRDTAGPPPLIPFPCMTYDDAINKYGSDKPDTRFAWQLTDVTAVLCSEGCSAQRLTASLQDQRCSGRAFVVPRGQKFLAKSIQKSWDELAQKDHQLSGVSLLTVRRSSDEVVLAGALARHLDALATRRLIELLGASPGDTIVLAAGATHSVLSLLGRLRLLAADLAEATGEVVRDRTRLHFHWVVDFPMFEQDDGGGLQSVHHPFTAPRPQDAHLLDTEPLKARSLHYDLVCNGCEVGGGSVRIHDSGLQQRVLQLLGIPASDLDYFTEALTMGAPPHAGIALGMERLVLLLSGSSSIREVMAFPKNSQGRCPMTGAPGAVDEELLRKLKIIGPASSSPP